MGARNKFSERYETKHEIVFIDQLASGRNAVKKLEGYIKGARCREDWGMVNGYLALAWATDRLRVLKKEVKNE